MRTGRRISAIRLWIVLLLAAQPAWPQQASRFRDDTAAIAAGADSSERRRALTARLDALGIEYRLQEFEDRRQRKGTNVIARLGANAATAGKSILVGAHYDRVAQGQGAVDNAASCAVLLDLLARLKARPLESYGITAVFFDLEEGGLSGSQAYFVPGDGKQLPAYALNLDIFGYGDAIFATSSNAQGTLASAMEQAASNLKFALRMTLPAEYPASDHRSMIGAGIETLGVALIDAREVDVVLNVLARRSTELPPVLTIIHTPKDTIDAIRAEEVEKAIPVLEQTLRLLDEKR